MTYPHTWPGHRPVYHPPTHPLLQIPYISLSCTVCDRETRVFAEFTKNFRKTFRKKMRISVEWIGSIPTEYQSHGEDFDGKFPPPPPPPPPPLLLSNMDPRYARWGIPLIGALATQNLLQGGRSFE